MALVLELFTNSSQPYIKNYIISIIREYKVDAVVRQQKGKVICAFTSEHTNLQPCLDAIAQRLPASCFLTGSKYYELDGEVDTLPEYEVEYPLALGLCPACQKEIFDPSSRRYYYPFTACTHCGGQYDFFNSFPYERSNTSMKFFKPCDDCENEVHRVGIRENYLLNSCHQCGIPVRMMNKKSERYANDAGSFRTMFEVAAKAILDNKRLLMKTTMGYRVFYKMEHMTNDSILMMINANKITHYVALIEKEFNALLSIERPILHVAIQDEMLKQKIGNSFDIKYPDDGFSILLASELQKLGEDFIFYEDVDQTAQADILIEFDLGITPQKDLRLFINKDVQFIASGERICFPSKLLPVTDTLSIAHGLIGVEYNDAMLFDTMEHFNSTKVSKVLVLEGQDAQQWHSKQHLMQQDEASFISVIAEHQLFGTSCIGTHFDEEASFLYYDGKKVIRIVPSRKFDARNFLEKMATLREGSNRLVENVREKMPDLYEKLQLLEKRGDVDFFEAVATVLDLEDKNMRGVIKESLKFIGKGGIQIDTHIQDNRFDHVAFLSSIISYQLGGVDSVMLCYSIFESLGDYFSDLIKEMQTKTKAKHIILCGSHFANQSLFSRMQRNLKLIPPFMNMNYPIGKENAVVGGVYL